MVGVMVCRGLGIPCSNHVSFPDSIFENFLESLLDHTMFLLYFCLLHCDNTNPTMGHTMLFLLE